MTLVDKLCLETVTASEV